jgi:hypothetical protein
VSACPDSFKVYKGLAGAIAGQDAPANETIEHRKQRLLGLIEPIKAGYANQPASVREDLNERFDKLAAVVNQKRDDDMSEEDFNKKLEQDMNAQVFSLAAWTAEQGTGILDSKPLPLHHMPNGIYQDVARYYLLLGDLLARSADPKMERMAPEAMAAYARGAASLERARDMDRAVNRKSREDRERRGMSDDKIIDVGNFRIYQNLGVIYMRLGKLPEAGAALEYMQMLEPTSPEGYFNLAMVKVAQQQAEVGGVLILEALVLKPDWPEAWNSMAQLMARIVPNQQVVQFNSETNSFSLAIDHPVVRRFLNQAIHNLCETMLRTRRPQHASEVRELGIGRYGCPPQIFDDLQMRYPTWKPRQVQPQMQIPGVPAPTGAPNGAVPVLPK